MAIPFDPAKRDKTPAERGLDFADAEAVFAGLLIENSDDRFDYGEERMVIVVWTWRDEDRHIISMRKANKREQRRYGKQMGGSG